jgi:hypothetical protein
MFSIARQGAWKVAVVDKRQRAVSRDKMESCLLEVIQAGSSCPKTTNRLCVTKRKRLNVSPKKKTTNKKKKSTTSLIEWKKEVLAKMTQEIASLKVQCIKELKCKKGNSSGADNDNAQDNAGCQFSGRKGKKRAKGVDSLGVSDIG